MIHPTAVIADNVTIEEDVYIGPLCVIGFPAEWKGQTENKGVIIKRGTVLTGLVTVDAGVERPTVIGEGCFLMKHSHIGHDAIICDNVTISCGAKIGGDCIVMENTTIGLNAVIHQRVMIPHGCMIGASSFVGKTLDMEPFGKYVGVPARWLGQNIKK